MTREASCPGSLAREQLRHCVLCEHRCRVNRSAGERGRCRAGTGARVYRHRVELGEEEELIPSHVFYLSGCDLRCDFCIAGEDAFDVRRGAWLDGGLLQRAIADGKRQGARNIQWLGGEPTVHLPAILAAMTDCSDLPPVIWKSNFHMTPLVFDLLDGIVTLYVADFKFGNDSCARRLARVDNYLAIVTRNLRLASIRTGLMVRHLLMPGHLECCTLAIIDWVAENLPEVKFSLRYGYLPAYRAHQHPELGQYVAPRDAEIASQQAQRAGLMLIE